jgi:hypothetical protein
MALSYQEQVVLRTAAAKQAVMELAARYGRALEQDDVQEWLSCFVVEGILEEPGRDPAIGHPALAHRFRELRHDVVHLTTDPTITVDGVKAEQESRFLVLERQGAAGAAIHAVGTYRDEFVYERGRWYIFRRTVVPAFS